MGNGSGRFLSKVAVVDGGSRGIGAEIARQLVDEGAKVVVGARSEEELATLQGELGHACTVIRTDVTSKLDVEAMADLAISRYGAIDALFHVAGGGRRRTVLDLSEDDLQRTLDLSLRSAFSGIQAVGRHMVKQSTGGVIVNISSLN